MSEMNPGNPINKRSTREVVNLKKRGLSWFIQALQTFTVNANALFSTVNCPSADHLCLKRFKSLMIRSTDLIPSGGTDFDFLQTFFWREVQIGANLIKRQETCPPAFTFLLPKPARTSTQPRQRIWNHLYFFASSN